MAATTVFAVAGLFALATPALAATTAEPETCGGTGSASSGSAFSGAGSAVTSPVSSVTFGFPCTGSGTTLDLGSIGSWFVGS